MSESPKSAAPAAAAAPPYTPSGAAASERMLSSVLGRVTGTLGTPIGRSLHFADRLVGGIVDGAGPVSGRGPAQRLFAQPVFGPPDAPGPTPAERPLTSESKSAPRRERSAPPQDLLTASPTPRRSADLKLPRSLRPTMALSSPERMFGSKSESGRRANPGPDGETNRLAQPVLSTGWEPPVAHAALELGKNPDSSTTMWGALPRPTLEPLLAAVAADLGKAEERRESPAMELLRGGAPEPPPGAAPKGPRSAITEEQAHRMAIESSKRLMEAVRAHAMASSGSDDRISLGDMALISFADSTKQMAAAESYSSTAPDPKPTQKAPGQLAHPKIKENQADLHNKLRAMAKLVAEDLKQVQKLAKERFGHG